MPSGWRFRSPPVMPLLLRKPVEDELLRSGRLQSAVSRRPRRVVHCTPFSGDSRIFIYPPYRFRVVDAMITNFHLPESTLLMLVSAFAGHEQTLAAYRHAVEQALPVFQLWRRDAAHLKRRACCNSIRGADAIYVFECQNTRLTRFPGNLMQFELLNTDGKARRGRLSFARGHGRNTCVHAGGHVRHG